jgi:hypothetical protein
MNVNQNGDPVKEEIIWWWSSEPLPKHEMQQIVLQLVQRLGLQAIRTNATDSGDVEMVLRKLGGEE